VIDQHGEEEEVMVRVAIRQSEAGTLMPYFSFDDDRRSSSNSTLSTGKRIVSLTYFYADAQRSFPLMLLNFYTRRYSPLYSCVIYFYFPLSF
jgi:hypothetical protein